MTTTAREIVVTKVAERLKRDAGIVQRIGAAIVLELTGEGGGRWLVDCSQQPATLTEDIKAAARTTISMDANVFTQLATGAMSPESAFLTGKVKVEGDLGVAIKLGQLLV